MFRDDLGFAITKVGKGLMTCAKSYSERGKECGAVMAAK
jgi:hypothetical protein